MVPYSYGFAVSKRAIIELYQCRQQIPQLEKFWASVSKKLLMIRNRILYQSQSQHRSLNVLSCHVPEVDHSCGAFYISEMLQHFRSNTSPFSLLPQLIEVVEDVYQEALTEMISVEYQAIQVCFPLSLNSESSFFLGAGTAAESVSGGSVIIGSTITRSPYNILYLYYYEVVSLVEAVATCQESCGGRMSYVPKMEVTLSSRLKSLYNIYSMMKRKEVNIHKVYDGRVLRVIVGNRSGTLHGQVVRSAVAVIAGVLRCRQNLHWAPYLHQKLL
ncbi:hypothetical protein Tco_1058514 [Tanacetum coccineum]|uniref:Uncharacterized protein n=1 Tax=Tanacetum coccineum TaxID=301880 RepID=A0ABQ5HAA7_9ASTR